MSAYADPHRTLNDAPMSVLQVTVVFITVCLNALDGFDAMSISYASPGIAREWHVTNAMLGTVMSMELIGMAAGSVLLGSLTDRIGRRAMMLGCVLLMGLGMLGATTSRDVIDLSSWRVITGLGIGGMLAAITAAAAEFANDRQRNFCVSMMSIGYPIGSIIGGSIAARLLQNGDWRSVFELGGWATLVFVPIIYFLVPESIQWLARKQPAGALDKINRILSRMGHATIAALPAVPPESPGRSTANIFSPGLIKLTLVITAAYFLHVTTFYFVIKWVPKIVVNMGFDPSQAAQVLVWSSVGGALGGAAIGFLNRAVRLKTLTLGTLLASTLLVVLFGNTPADLFKLKLVCLGCGFFINGGIVGLYAMFAQVFPTHARASGTGFAIGFGRGGAVLAPIIAGFLFDAGLGLPAIATMMAIGSLLGAGALLWLRLGGDHAENAKATG
ncbi:MAG: MFS transporter [Gammaproteobacteria bacterium]|nr:MFS transporter [Gammaproteobacteria bacterium]